MDWNFAHVDRIDDDGGDDDDDDWGGVEVRVEESRRRDDAEGAARRSFLLLWDTMDCIALIDGRRSDIIVKEIVREQC